VKGDFWKKQEFFDLIQLTRKEIFYNHEMLLASIHFWESSTNTFQLPCGMLTPTLFDIAAITGLRPTGQVFDPTKIKNPRDFFDFQKTGLNSFLAENMATGPEVSDKEHIAFLTYWLNFFVFCPSSLQITVSCSNLAIQLHQGKDICLAKLILAILYDSLHSASFYIKASGIPNDNLLTSGPLWLLQFWLNANFQHKINQEAPAGTPRDVEGYRLNAITLVEPDLTATEAFNKWFGIFSRQKKFLSSMSPFADRVYGPEWFRRKFPPTQPLDDAESKDIWYQFLKPTLLSSSFQTGPKGLGLVAYQPNLVARQFGLSQLLPCPIFLRREDVIFAATPLSEKLFKDFLSKENNKTLGLDFFFFEPTFICTMEFDKWWATHYKAKVLDDVMLHQFVLAGINEVIQHPDKIEPPSKVLTTLSYVVLKNTKNITHILVSIFIREREEEKRCYQHFDKWSKRQQCS
jgi:hypothetical protein